MKRQPIFILLRLSVALGIATPGQSFVPVACSTPQSLTFSFNQEAMSNTATQFRAPLNGARVEVLQSTPHPEATVPETFEPASVTVFDTAEEMGESAARRIVEVIRTTPHAVIILPTGSTPQPLYRSLIRLFESDHTIDLSQAIFYNLDDYVGMPEDHPLSYTRYMQTVLFGPLETISATRAPKQHFVPHADHLDSANQIAAAYEASLHEAIAARGGKADLVVLGVGGAYPVEEADGTTDLHGGHIGFNEPGSLLTDRTRVIELTKKTRKDTSHSFTNMQHRPDRQEDWTDVVPLRAITMGIANILESREVILMANGEEKSIVMQTAWYRGVDENFPVTYLRHHPHVHWLLEHDAANKLPHVRTPWRVYPGYPWTRERLRQAIIELLIQPAHEALHLYSVHAAQLSAFGIPLRATLSLGGLIGMRRDLRTFLRDRIHSDENPLLPKNSVIAFSSPHPDDDVITSAATIKKMIERGNEVHVFYMTGGENGVRGGDTALEKIEIREAEARAALAELGLTDQSRLHFLKLPYYYTRGFIDRPALSHEGDVLPVQRVLEGLMARAEERNTDLHLYYSAEADPHGAHGLGKEAIRRALQNLKEAGHRLNLHIFGYRGAYEEWPLWKNPERLTIVPFEASDMEVKTSAIMKHSSQLRPLFPSFDKREFFQRAFDRNSFTGRVLVKLGYLSEGTEPWFVEVFHEFTLQEFLNKQSTATKAPPRFSLRNFSWPRNGRAIQSAA